MSPTAREMARRELVSQITAVARRQLATLGAPNLALRGVARELGMAPSALYRYFPSRDALLTALIVEAYQGVADAAGDAEACVPGDDYAGRWLAVFRAVRGWALAHPHEYALVYGSPVPGYVAPEETIDPAREVVFRLARIAIDAFRGPGLTPTEAPPLSEPLRADARARQGDVLGLLPEEVSAGLDGFPPGCVIAVLDAWTALYGAVSFELFGHYDHVIDARADHLDHLARTTGRTAGIPGL